MCFPSGSPYLCLLTLVPAAGHFQGTQVSFFWMKLSWKMPSWRTPNVSQGMFSRWQQTDAGLESAKHMLWVLGPCFTL